MKKNILLSAIILHSLLASAQRFDWLTYATHSPSYPWAPDAVDPAGNIYTLIGTGPGGAIIQNDTIHGLTAGDGVIIAKFSPTGNLLWGKMVSQDGGLMGPCDIAVDNSGAVYACTGFGNGGNVNMADTVFSSGGGGDVIIKLDSGGHFVRATIISGARPQITCLGTDIYISANEYIEKIDSALNTVWVKSAPPGYLWFDGGGSGDIFAANGELVASCTEGGGSGPVPFSNDSVYFSAPAFDEVAIVKMDTSGQLLWSRTLPSAGAVLQAVCLDSHDNVYVGMKNATLQYVFAGDTLFNTLGGNGYCIAFKWDSAGTPLWGRGIYPVSGQLELLDMAVNGQDELLVSGHAPGNLSFNNDTLLSASGSMYLMKVSPAGNFTWYKADEILLFATAYADGIAVRNGNEYILAGATNNPATYQFGCISITTPAFFNFVTAISENPEAYPVASFTYSVSNDTTYTFTDASLNATAWHWDFGDGDTSNLQIPSHNFTTGGNYTVILTVYHGACSSTDTLQIIGVGINEVNVSKPFFIYPNPSPGNFTISFPGASDKMSIEIFTAVGKKIFSAPVTNNSEKQISLKNISSGVYFVKLFRGENIYCTKLIIE